MRRMLLLAAALAIPASALSVALTTGVASAGGGPKGKTVCSTLSGTVASLVISGCVDANGASTGGGTPPFSGSLLVAGGTLTWLSGGSTTSGTPTLTSTSAKHCPDPLGLADKVSAPITASTVGFKIPGKFKGTVCIARSGAITNHGPLKVN